MASTVIDHLEQARRCDTIITFAFCNYKDRASQTAVNLFASLLRQVLEGKQQPLPETYRMLTENQFRSQRSTLQELSSYLRAELATFARTFVIVDAIDEFEDDVVNTVEFISELRRLATSANANIIITSRPILHIEQAFARAIRSEISAASSDIYAYLSERMPQLPKCVLRKVELQEQIKQKITDAADGMYAVSYLSPRVRLNAVRYITEALSDLAMSPTSRNC